ncbi:hypothetical protein ABIA33_005940 [Streptacidiphilus sp. MAP12-16]|jgi:hypothetical protein|uniref:hypothetical protein n=1 Tax=Streptacidiphilus sp. MAP12-16 TaxID=3156300 RepID=UPI003516F817
MSGSARTSSASSTSEGASILLRPVEAVTSAVRQAPGASTVKEVFDGVLDTVGVVSPHARRVAAYAGVGLLGVAGVVEWPVAAAGAAVVWLTQPRGRSAGSGAGQPAAARKPAAVAAAADRPKTKPAAKPSTAKRSTAKRSTAKAPAAKAPAVKSSGTRSTAPATGRRATSPRPAESTSSGQES